MWHTLKLEEIRRKLRTNFETGLTEEEANFRQKKYGSNELANKKKPSVIIKFLNQFKDFMIIILIVAAIVSLGLSYIEHTNEYIDSIIIITIVVLNAILGVVQESKAEKSLEALKKMSAPTSMVKRNGILYKIESSKLVPGDIVYLEAGLYVPADVRLIESYNLKIEESALTGETTEVEKDSKAKINSNVQIADMKNMAFATTIVVSGHAKAVVVETGMNTSVGKIATMIMSNENEETPLQVKLGEVGKKLGLIALGICFIIFIIGLLKKVPPIEIFMTSVGLAVAAIPEGLPAIVTILLSIGVTKMAKQNSIIRKLPAVETLGSSRVICSDKTGTLTQNKMTVVKIFENGMENTKSFTSNTKILSLACMCTDCETNEKGEIEGEATEKAIVAAALNENLQKNELYKINNRIGEISFDSTRKLMTTIHKTNDGYRIITKGAPDVLLKKCNKIDLNNGISILDDVEKNKILNKNNDMAKEALRVIAVAYSDIKVLPSKIDEKLENNLVFVGLIGMIDPPREGVKEAVLECKRAGIKTVMITGDHIITAKAIAKDLGILTLGDKTIAGEELENISQKELERDIMNYSVFARVTPEHKVRIVNAFKANGNIVAMTGDGVNDAPALKGADIGIAMGKNGTDVAKNASDMILTDDNFVTIVEAVKNGRHIYENIKKAVHFLLATNIGEIVAIFFGLLLGWDTPLLAIQLLWVNLVTDSLPAIALGMEPMEKDIMKQKPKDTTKGLFADGLWGKIFIEGTMIGILTLLAFSIGNNFYNLKVARTMAFISISILELIHSINIRTDKSIFTLGMFKNIYLTLAIFSGIVLQLIITIIPSLSKVFQVTSLNSTQWMIVGAISIMPIILVELQKKLNEYRYGKIITIRVG